MENYQYGTVVDLHRKTACLSVAGSSLVAAFFSKSTAHESPFMLSVRTKRMSLVKPVMGEWRFVTHQHKITCTRAQPIGNLAHVELIATHNPHMHTHSRWKIRRKPKTSISRLCSTLNGGMFIAIAQIVRQCLRASFRYAFFSAIVKIAECWPTRCLSDAPPLRQQLVCLCTR